MRQLTDADIFVEFFGSDVVPLVCDGGRRLCPGKIFSITSSFKKAVVFSNILTLGIPLRLAIEPYEVDSAFEAFDSAATGKDHFVVEP